MLGMTTPLPFSLSRPPPPPAAAFPLPLTSPSLPPLQMNKNLDKFQTESRLCRGAIDTALGPYRALQRCPFGVVV